MTRVWRADRIVRCMDWREEIRHVVSYPFGPSSGNCDGCGIFLWSQLSLCTRCLEELDRTFSESLKYPHPLDPQITCRGLWDWNPGESDALSAAILGLKGRGKEKTWARLAELTLGRHAVEVFQKPEIRIVAMPNADPRRTHATDFAKGFADIVGVPLESLESATSAQSPQKRKTRRQRLAALRQLAAAESSKTLAQPRETTDFAAKAVLWVLVDDIVTTGATSLMALRRLREKTRTPGNSYEIWSLARRSRLAP